jgi:hypothetical protein
VPYALFMDVRPPKNTPRPAPRRKTISLGRCSPSNDSKPSVGAAGGERRETAILFPPSLTSLGTMMARGAADPIPIERRLRAARRS